MKELHPMITAHNLTKKYHELIAVNDISFIVNSSEVFAFLGPNGAGKTTTIKMLTTILNPTSGLIKINGFDPISQKNEARTSFGIVFQDESLDEELTAQENMEFHAAIYHVPDKISKKRIPELLKLFELWDRKNDPVKFYSGGMKRRLEIARSFIHHPRILFLDEPTLGLDPQTRNFTWKYLMHMNKKEKITLFFTTHYIEEAEKYADRVAIIDCGKIIKVGSPKELMKSTKTKTLEDAFLKITGHHIKDEKASAKDMMRLRRRIWRR